MCVADLHRLRGCFQLVSFRKVKQGIPERDSESDSRFGLKPQTQGIVVPVEQVWSADGQCWLEKQPVYILIIPVEVPVFAVMLECAGWLIVLRSDVDAEFHSECSVEVPDSERLHLPCLAAFETSGESGLPSVVAEIGVQVLITDLFLGIGKTVCPIEFLWIRGKAGCGDGNAGQVQGEAFHILLSRYEKNMLSPNISKNAMDNDAAYRKATVARVGFLKCLLMRLSMGVSIEVAIAHTAASLRYSIKKA